MPWGPAGFAWCRRNSYLNYCTSVQSISSRQKCLQFPFCSISWPFHNPFSKSSNCQCWSWVWHIQKHVFHVRLTEQINWVFSSGLFLSRRIPLMLIDIRPRSRDVMIWAVLKFCRWHCIVMSSFLKVSGIGSKICGRTSCHGPECN